MNIINFDLQSQGMIQISPDTGSVIVPIYNFTTYNKAGYRLFAQWVEFRNIKITSWIYSTAKVPFPVYELEDSESAQLLKAINLEWDSPRIELEMLMTIDGGENWYPVRKFSLINNDPYPFREFEVGDFSVGDNAQLGFRVRDVGFGGLTTYGSFVDSVVIYADIVRHVHLEKLVSGAIPINNTITTSPGLIVPENPQRSGISFFNNNNVDIYVDTIDTVSNVSFTAKLEKNDYFEPVNAAYTGAYYAVADSGEHSLQIREFE